MSQSSALNSLYPVPKSQKFIESCKKESIVLVNEQHGTKSYILGKAPKVKWFRHLHTNAKEHSGNLGGAKWKTVFFLRQSKETPDEAK